METAKEDCIANLVDAIHDLQNVRSEIKAMREWMADE